MPALALGAVEAGFYRSGDCELNGAQLGEVTVLSRDADSALTNAINALDGVTAILSNGNLTLEWSGQLVIDGLDPTGGGCVVQFEPGTYE
tara:strand:+ start:149 stop:418 length:270 start_codon:yes stop_codon:yes gene_type:complete